MKRYFWFGLFVGCLSSLLALGLTGIFRAAAAQSNNAQLPTDARLAAMADINQELPQGGGDPGPLGTGFSYQGLLKKNGAPVNGGCDLRFKLYDSQTAGFQYGATLDFPNTTVANGVFTVYLDFGDQFNGDKRYLETSVSCPSSPSPSFTALPRQLLAASPYALSLRPGATISGTASTRVLSIYAQGDGTGLSVINTGGISNPGAIYALARDGTAVFAFADTLTGNGVGVRGATNSKDGVGVIAQGASDGAALAIANGGIKVYSAGIGSDTPVFIHQVHTGVGGNVCDAPYTYQTAIDNTLINGNPNAMLIVTPNYGPVDTGVSPAVATPAVYYDATNQCGRGAGKWVIFSMDGTTQVDHSLFNVMAVVP
jgi:hypothetical protein